MKLLVIGGTRFLGRFIVEKALSRGFDVTLFNRGKTNPDLFPNLELIKGDRDKDLDKLSGRSWDVVVDTCGYYPKSVKKTVEALAGKVQRYIFVSSVSVYSDFDCDLIDEGSPCTEPESSEDLENTDNRTYGIRKKACEEVIIENFKGQAAIVRPGLIVGPYDPSWRFPYWIDRVKSGGEILAPGDSKETIQFIDVRDLASWIVYIAEKEISGIYNAVGPDTEISFGEFLNTCKSCLNPQSKLNWVADEFLVKNKVNPWMELPLWVPQNSRGLHRGSNRMAREKGLKFSSVEETIYATEKWISESSKIPDRSAALQAEKETLLLNQWNEISE